MNSLMMKVALAFCTLATSTFALTLSSETGELVEPYLSPKQYCENTPTSRSCWGDFDIDTNYYTTFPDTGVTREYWLSVEDIDCAPDGYNTTCKAFNGTIPGPTIIVRKTRSSPSLFPGPIPSYKCTHQTVGRLGRQVTYSRDEQSR